MQEIFFRDFFVNITKNDYVLYDYDKNYYCFSKSNNDSLKIVFVIKTDDVKEYSKIFKKIVNNINYIFNNAKKRKNILLNAVILTNNIDIEKIKSQQNNYSDEIIINNYFVDATTKKYLKSNENLEEYDIEKTINNIFENFTSEITLDDCTSIIEKFDKKTNDKEFIYFKNLFINLLKVGYLPIKNATDSEEITEETPNIFLGKTVGATAYIVVLRRAVYIDDYDILQNLNINLSKMRETFRNIILLTIFVTGTTDKELNKYTNVNDIIGNEELIELRWIANPSTEELIINGSQPKSLNGIEKVVKKSFSKEINSSPTMITNEIDNILKEKHQSERERNSLITIILLLANLGFFLLQCYVKILYGQDEILNILALNNAKVFENHEYYRIISSFFIHLNLLHFGSNALFLYVIGSTIEKRFGKKFFILCYFLSGISASVFTLFLNDYSYSLGASGAVFGLIGAMFAYISINKETIRGFDFNTIFALSALNISFGFIIPGVNNIAHISGFLTGILLMIINLKIFNKTMENKIC